MYHADMAPQDEHGPLHAGDRDPQAEGNGASSQASEESALIFSTQAVRAIDRLAMERYGIPTILLMENAARGLAHVALDRLDPARPPTAIILCGPGNNGGDGLAAARHLHNAGMDVAVVLSHAETRSEEAKLHLGIVRAMNLTVVDGSMEPAPAAARAVEILGSCSLVIDALLGTGLTRAPQGAVRALIDWANDAGKKGATVISADIPTGMDADTGRAIDATVRAHTTVTFAGLKQGFLELAAQPYLGEVVVVDIGVPRELLEQFGHLPDPPSHHESPSDDSTTLAMHGDHPGQDD